VMPRANPVLVIAAVFVLLGVLAALRLLLR
jgi:hypothetical protein